MKPLFAYFIWLVPIFLLSGPVRGQTVVVTTELSDQLNDRVKQTKMHFPKSVQRYYSQNGLKLAWITKGREKQAFEAMMILDCVLQYGLAHADYHPDILLYNGLQEMLDAPDSSSVEYRVRFDIFLTDALITLINHLHYGKLNPLTLKQRLTGSNGINEFDTVDQLNIATNSSDFTAALLAVQPKSRIYVDLQAYMRLIKGQYLGDCYVVPESSVRKVAINMERLRWWEFSENNTTPKQGLYLTCEIKDGLPVFYPDTRHLDPALEAAMYNSVESKISNSRMPIKLKKE